MKKLMILLIVAGTTAFQRSEAQSAQPDNATLNFVTQASKGGMTEVNTAKLALQRAQSADVKSFASRMVTDHSKANAELTQLVKSKGWNIIPPKPADVMPDAMLVNSSGASFDKAYVSMMVQDHKKTIGLFESTVNSSADPAIKAFAKKTLPVIRQHLASIQAIAKKMGITY